MNNQNAVQVIEKMNTPYMNDVFRDALKNATQALLLLEKKSLISNKGWLLCPSCFSRIAAEQEGSAYKFCHECGQALMEQKGE